MSTGTGQSPDLSRIISLIMQNPDLIRQIEGLARQDSAEPTNESTESDAPADAPVQKAITSAAPAIAAQDTGKREKRTRLLSALRPYVSEKRSKTLDTLIGAMDIFDLIGRG